MRKIGRKKNSFFELFAAFCSGAVIIGILWLWYGSKQNDSVPTLGSSQANSSVLTFNNATQSQQSQQTQSGSGLTGGQTLLTVSQETGSIPAKTRVKYKIDHFKKLALQPLEFEVFDENNKALTADDLKIVQAHRLHFIVVSADYKEYQHLYPDFDQGKWKVLAYLPTPGTYYAYVDIAPVKGNPIVLRSELIVRDPSKTPIAYPALTPADNTGKLAVSDGPYQARLSFMRANLLQQTLFSYELSALDQGAIPLLQTYVGNLGHAIVLKQGDPDVFLHLHQTTQSDAQKAQVQFMTTFSKAGKYTVFAEFKIDGKVYTFSDSFEIT